VRDVHREGEQFVAGAGPVPGGVVAIDVLGRNLSPSIS